MRESTRDIGFAGWRCAMYAPLGEPVVRIVTTEVGSVADDVWE
jgi:hypothetical protein